MSIARSSAAAARARPDVGGYPSVTKLAHDRRGQCRGRQGLPYHRCQQSGTKRKVEFGELHIPSGPGFVVTIRYAESPDLARVRRRLEDHPELLCLGPESVLYTVLDQVVDEYAPVVAVLENDIDEIEDQLFKGDPVVARRVYELLREVMAFQRAVHPLSEMMRRLEACMPR